MPPWHRDAIIITHLNPRHLVFDKYVPVLVSYYPQCYIIGFDEIKELPNLDYDTVFNSCLAEPFLITALL